MQIDLIFVSIIILLLLLPTLSHNTLGMFLKYLSKALWIMVLSQVVFLINRGLASF